MRIMAKSDIGRSREMNQDSFYVSDLKKDEIKLYILADGMGGYKGGEVASSLAVKSVKNFVFNNFRKTKKDRESILQLLKAAIEYANMVVYQKAREDLFVIRYARKARPATGRRLRTKRRGCAFISPTKAIKDSGAI